MRLIDRIGTSLSGVHHYARLNPPVGLVWRVGSGARSCGTRSDPTSQVAAIPTLQR